MTANKVAKNIVSNVSSFCSGFFGYPLPHDSIPALEASTEKELKEYRPSYERKGAAIYAGDKFIYQLASEEQAQELVDALSTYV